MPRLLVRAVFIALLLPLGADGQQTALPSKEDIAKAIRELASPRFATRERAVASLWHTGRAAEAALYEARAGAELEAARRIDGILEKFKWGIYPDTPADVLASIAKYRAAALDGRQRILKELFDRGAAGYPVVARLIAVEDNEGIRQQLFQPFRKAVELLIPDLLQKRAHGPLEDVLRMRLAGAVESAVRDLAVYLLLTDRIDEALPHYRARAARPGDPQATLILAYLYRAKGDLAGARAVAEKTGNLPLLQTLLYEQGDWKALSQRSDKLGERDGGDEFKAAYHRLAGRTEAFEQIVAALVKAAERKPDNDGTLWWEAKALFLNDRPREALTVLARGPDPGMAFSVLCAQQRFREAFEVLDRAKGRDAKQVLRAEMLRLKALQRLGEKEEVAKVLAAVEKQLEGSRDSDRATELVRILQQSGLEEPAYRHAAALLDRGPPADFHKGMKNAGSAETYASSILGGLFPDQTAHVRHWWAFLRDKQKEASLVTLGRLRDLFAGKVKGDALADLLAGAAKAAGKLPPEERESWLDGVAAVADKASDTGLARKYLEEAVASVGNAASFRKLGDHLIEKKLWKDAAEVLERGVQKYPADAVLRYLGGLALARGGREKEGRERMELARWLPLGEDDRRGDLAAALHKHGLADEARREFEMILKTGRPNSWHTGEAWRRLHNYAAQAKDYLRAAACWERFYLRVLEAGSMFVEDEAYVLVPHRAHWLRARGLLAAKDLGGAWKEAQICLTLLPGNADVPILFVPELVKRGQKERADELFTKVADIYERVSKDYPRDAAAHNSLGWLAARCRRQLDRGLAHARKAVELEPANAGYLDTLAEVHFQRGDQAEAIRLMRRCLELTPDRDYYQRQLKRFQAGDPLTEVIE